MNEAGARKVVLVRAIEATDNQGKLVSRPEIDQIDQRLAAQVRAGAATVDTAAQERFLQQRADQLLQVVDQRNRKIASLQSAGPWQRAALLGLPAGALVLGILGDQVANPHQVNLLSKPLLLILLWNVAIYLVLAAQGLMALGQRKAAPARFAWLREWLAQLRDRRSRAGVAAHVTASFYTHWHTVTSALQAQRIARVMHWSAAAWAVGVALSIAFGGLFAQYRVGWESTFFEAPQVHRFLGVLLAPVAHLMPDAAISLDEVAQLEAGAGGTLGGLKQTGQRWVLLYAMLLGIVVVIPRTLLAALAGWREQRLARAVRLDLADPHYQRPLSLLVPTRVRLAVCAQRDADRLTLLARLQEVAMPVVLATEPGGGSLELVDLPAGAVPPDDAPSEVPRASWIERLLGSVRNQPAPPPPAGGALQRACSEADVVLNVMVDAQDLAAAAPWLAWRGKPVVTVLLPGAHLDAQARQTLAAQGARVIDFAAFRPGWLHEKALLDAVEQCLPDFKRLGFGRLRADRRGRHAARLHEAMRVLADQLLDAARQARSTAPPPNSLKSLVHSGERDAWDNSRQAAMDTIVEDLRQRDAATMNEMLRLHRIDATAAGPISTGLQQNFEIARAQPTSKATLAGAASGAAMGAGIDLLTAGLSLGLAAAAGAVVGGGAAFIASAWKDTGGQAVVQLSDEMMQALVEAALLRYLAVIHYDGAGGEAQPGWRGEVVAAVEQKRDTLNAHWAAERAARSGAPSPGSLPMLLEDLAMKILRRLYPEIKE